MKVFANNARDGKKGWVVGDNEGNKLWFVQVSWGVCASLRVILFYSLYFTLKEIAVVTYFESQFSHSVVKNY